MGEPHTQEHLLLGKGNKGRELGSQETMSLATSTAFTMQWRTCYSFYTSAGPDVFFRNFDRAMDVTAVSGIIRTRRFAAKYAGTGVGEDPKDDFAHSFRRKGHHGL